MPTVIDELVVTLGLDPKQFDNVQQESLNKLREFEQTSTAASARIEEAMKKGMAAFFREFRAAIDPTQQGLNNLGDQSRRAGEKIHAAGVTSALGFKGLTTSLLEAYAVVGTLEGALHKLESSTSRATGTMITALGMGTQPRELAAWAGIFTQTGFGAAEQSLSQLQAFWSNWRAGKPNMAQAQDFTRYAGLAHVPVAIQDLQTYQSFLLKIGEIEKRLPARQRGPFLASQGLPASMIYEFLKPQTQILRDYQASLARQPTNSVSRDLTQMNSEIGKVRQSWNTLWETLTAKMYNEAGGKKTFGALDQELQTLTKDMNSSAGGVKALMQSLTALAGLVAIRTLISLFSKLGAAAAPIVALLSLINLKGATPDQQGSYQRWLSKHWVPVPGAVNPTTGQVVESVGAHGAITYYPGTGHAPSQKPPATPTHASIGESTRPSANNPGNIRGAGGVGFALYSTPQAGYDAIRENLLAYEDKHHINTLRGIISRWAPPSENPTPQLIANASRRTGFLPDQPLDLHDPATLRKLIAAIIWQEQGHRPNKKLLATAVPAAASSSTSSPYALVSTAHAATASPRTAPASTPADAGWHWYDPTTWFHFQHGGIVPIAAHAGEAVLPTRLTDLLLAVANASSVPLGGLSYARAGGGAMTVHQPIHIGSISVHAPQIADARGLAREVRGALRRELSARSTVQVVAANTIFE